MTVNDELLSKLEDWASNRLLRPRCFDCQHYSTCNERLATEGTTLDLGNSVAMTYVGTQYGNLPDAPRLLLVGLDHGAEDRGFDFRDRRAQIQQFKEGRDRFNPHYKGVIQTASAALTPLVACDVRCTSSCSWSQTREGPCALDFLAQANLVKCSASTSFKGTPLISLCVNWLVEEINILEPTIIVFHGVAAKWAFPKAVADAGWSLTPIEGSSCSDLFWLHGPPRAAAVLFLHHPSASRPNQWPNNWPLVGEPALRFIRNSGLV